MGASNTLHGAGTGMDRAPRDIGEGAPDEVDASCSKWMRWRRTEAAGHSDSPVHSLVKLSKELALSSERNVG